MARIRTIKPELCEDETLGSCSREARLLFILLWTRCDDHGRFRASPMLLKGQLFPYDLDLSPQTVAGWLDDLTSAGRVRTYTVNGQTYGAVVNWSKHQRIDNASRPLYPPDPCLGEPPRDSAGLGEPPLDLDPDLDQDPDLDPAADLGELWQLLAERALRDGGMRVKRPAAWKRKVAHNAQEEHEPEARRLLALYPDITVSQLADALSGGTNVLRYLRRVDAEETA